MDILVNNAGLGTNHDAVHVTEEEWEELLDVNLKELFFAYRGPPDGARSRGLGTHHQHMPPKRNGLS